MNKKKAWLCCLLFVVSSILLGSTGQAEYKKTLLLEKNSYWGEPEQVLKGNYYKIPDIAIDSEGTVHVFASGISNLIYYNTKTRGSSWDGSLHDDNILDFNLDNVKPGFLSTYIDSDDTIYLVWDVYGDGPKNIFYAYKPKNGIWSEAEVVSVNYLLNLPTHPKITVDNCGTIHVVWCDELESAKTNELQNVICYNSKKINGDWGDSIVISQNGDGDSWAPDIACDSQCNVHVVWYYSYNQYTGICYNHKQADTPDWSDIEAITINSKVNSPSIAIDSKDMIHVVWVYNYNLHQIQYAKRVNCNWEYQGFISNDLENMFYKPDLTIDSNDRFHIIWIKVINNPFHRPIIYKFFDGTSWSDEEEIVYSINGGMSPPSIVIDERKPHIVFINNSQGSDELFYISKNIAGDVNGDGDVDQSDLGILLASYNRSPDDPFYDPRADINGDGGVNQQDLGILLAHYGESLP